MSLKKLGKGERKPVNTLHPILFCRDVDLTEKYRKYLVQTSSVSTAAARSLVSDPARKQITYIIHDDAICV